MKNIVEKPACSIPRLKPPHPANKSIKVCFFKAIIRLWSNSVGKDTKKTGSTAFHKDNPKEKHFGMENDDQGNADYALYRSAPSQYGDHTPLIRLQSCIFASLYGAEASVKD